MTLTGVGPKLALVCFSEWPEDRISNGMKFIGFVTKFVTKKEKEKPP